MIMEDRESVAPLLEGEENVIAAAKHMLMALESNKDLISRDARELLSELGARLSEMAVTEDPVDGEIQENLNLVQGRIISWEEADESGSDEAFEYLMAVEEAQRLTVRLEQLGLGLGFNQEERQVLQRAHNVLRTALAREEFKHILVQHRDTVYSFHSSDHVADDDSFVDWDNSTVSSRRISEDSIMIDLVRLDVISDLRFRSIANLMFISNYDHKDSQAFIVARKEALEDFLVNTGMDKLSTEDVLKIKRWIWAIKVFIRVHLTSEKRLSEQFFGLASDVCFVEASKSSMLRLLQFAHAMSAGHLELKKLMRILDMYEVLAELLPDIDALFSNEAGSSVRNEYHEVLNTLGDSIRVTVSEFKDNIATDTSEIPFQGGGVHPMTYYVMNYIHSLTDYSGTLNLVFKDQGGRDSLSPETVGEEEECTSSPMALQFLSITTTLKANLYHRSKLYKDASLRHIFLMNNLYYMAQKVKSSELSAVFRDKWIRNYIIKFQKHVLEYIRATWHSILPLLKDEGASSLSRANLKERLRTFHAAFEEVYKTQTAWVISDGQLREDVLISTSQIVIQAYRSFVGRHYHQIYEKHIKYTTDDLQNYLLDLFEGSKKSLPNARRRWRTFSAV